LAFKNHKSRHTFGMRFAKLVFTYTPLILKSEVRV
jgi:hypothetical protein